MRWDQNSDPCDRAGWRLSERRLIENTRRRGSEKAWQLTATGDELERAIWLQTPAAEQRSIALDLLKDRGGRLNHRATSVLRVIAADPALSNLEVALRVGVKSKGHASTLLARLARHGLIENTRTGGRAGPSRPSRVPVRHRELKHGRRQDRLGATFRPPRTAPPSAYRLGGRRTGV